MAVLQDLLQAFESEYRIFMLNKFEEIIVIDTELKWSANSSEARRQCAKFIDRKKYSDGRNTGDSS